MAEKRLRVIYDGDASGVTRAQQQIAKGQDGLRSKIAAFGSKLTSIGKGMSIGLTAPIVAFGAKAVSSFNEAQKVAAGTEAVIRSTGGAAGVTAERVGQLATQLSRMSGADDEAIQGAENLLLTFTKIGGDIFPEATTAIVDMATAMNKGNAATADFQGATIQVGKALNDPIKGITALSRVGVSFTEQQKEQIKALVESGDVMGAQKIILKELQTEFGGAAKAFGQTDAGKQAKAMVDLGNAMEGIGAAIAPIVTKVASFVSTLAGAFQRLSPGMQNIILIVVAVVAALGPLLTIIGGLITVFAAMSLTVGIVIGVIAALIIIGILVWKNWQTIVNALKVAWNGLKAAAIAVFNFLKMLFLNFTPLGLIIQHWETIKGFLLGVWNAIQGAAAAVWNGITGVISGAVNTVKGIVTGVADTIKSVISGAWDAVKSGARAAWQFVVDKIQWAKDRVTSIVNGLRRAFCNLPFVRCSPIPLVEDAKATVAGVTKAFSKMRTGMGGELGRVSFAGAGGGGGRAGGPRVMNVTINVSGGGNAKEVANEVRRELLRLERRTGKLFAA